MISEHSEHFSFAPSTLHLAITIVDRVLKSGRPLHDGTGKRQSSHLDLGDDYDDNEDDGEDDRSKDTQCYIIPRDRFQLLGATCVWIACKIQEVAAPKAKEIAYVSDHIYNIEQIKTMERRVCNALNFKFFEYPTPHQFLFEFIRAKIGRAHV